MDERTMIYLDDAIDAIEMHLEQSEDDDHDKTWNNAVRGAINAVKHHTKTAQPDLLEDGTLMMTVPNGMLNDVKRVLVDEVGTKNCKVMYQDEPERKKGVWIWNDEMKCFLCSECEQGWREQPTLNGKPLFEWCPVCGADMRGEEHEAD